MPTTQRSNAVPKGRLRPLLPSPDPSPQPSGLVENLPDVARSALRLVPQNREAEERERRHNRAVDQVSHDIAKAVVNMQEYYAHELQTVTRWNDHLVARQHWMEGRMSEMEKRLQTHLVLMDGFVSFMREVKDGRFVVPQRLSDEEMVAQSLGGEYVDLVRSLQPIQPPARLSPASHHQTQPPSNRELSYSGDNPLAEGEYDNVGDLEGDVDEPPEPKQPSRKRKDASIAQQRKPKRIQTASSLTQDEDLQAAAIMSGIRYDRSTGKLGFTPTDDDMGEELSAEPSKLRFRTRPAAVSAVNREPPAPLAEQQNGESSLDGDYEPDSDYELEDEEEESLALEEETEEDSDDETQSEAEAPSTTSPIATPNSRKRSSRSSPCYEYASGPSERPFKYGRMPKTVAKIWQEYYRGLNGNPPISILERTYGTGWRTGNLKERKYGRNYVALREMVALRVDDMCSERGIKPAEACHILDSHVLGRIQKLIAAIRNGKDPLVVIPPKRKRRV